MKRLLIALLCVSLFVSCKPKDQTPPATVKNVTVAQYAHLLIYYPIYLAKQKGFFEQNKLNVTFSGTGGDDKTFAAVSAHSAMFGVADPTFVAIAKEKGLKAKIVGTLIDGAPMWIVSKEKIDMNSPAALQNKRIMTYSSPSTSYTLLSEIISTLKPKTDGASIVQGAFGTEFAMVDNKSADGFFSIEPVVSTAVDQGYHVVYSAMSQFGPMSFSGISVLDETLAKDPETVKAFLKATQQALDFLRSNFDEAVELAAKEFPETKKEIIKAGLKRMVDEKVMPATLETKEASLNNAIAIRQKVGDLKATPQFSEIATNDFLPKK
jgi:NitT/TauT family transport system substrate-binding protein